MKQISHTLCFYQSNLIYLHKGMKEKNIQTECDDFLDATAKIGNNVRVWV